MLYIFLQSTSNPLTSILPLVLMIVVFYFFMIRPQAKKQKEQQSFLDGLQKGDRVITGSGILGKITKIDTTNNIITLEVDTKTHIRVTRSAISKELTESHASALMPEEPAS